MSAGNFGENMTMKLLRYHEIEQIRNSVPSGVRVEVVDSLVLKGGDIWYFRIASGEHSVVVWIDTESDRARRAKMRIFWVEEDSHAPSWKEEFRALENAVKRAVEIVTKGERA